MNAPRIHELKVAPKYYAALRDHTKNFEVRINDRGFAVGDVLHLLEYRVDAFTPDGRFTGWSLHRRVLFILTDDFPGLQHGYVCMALVPCAPDGRPFHSGGPASLTWPDIPKAEPPLAGFGALRPKP
jgi:hypothetical protein